MKNKSYRYILVRLQKIRFLENEIMSELGKSHCDDSEVDIHEEIYPFGKRKQK